jgi:sugar/nucleoside kinase (ribokinase family)
MNDALFRDVSLCVVGNINRDVKTSPLPPSEHLFRDGETRVSSVIETVGGGGANSACAAASLGAQVTFVGKVGNDELGYRLERTLERCGVTAHLARDHAVETGTSINLTYETGQRHFVSSLTNNESLALEDLNLDAIANCTHLLRADIWFSEAMLFGGNERLLRHARETGASVSIDLNGDPCWGRASSGRIEARKRAARNLLQYVNLAHGNVRELNEFADSDDLATTLKRLDEWGVEAVVVHMGSEGAGYYWQGQFWKAPAVPARRQVNFAGTGDVLSVCMMLLHQCEALSVQEKLRLANAVVSEFIAGERPMIPVL